MKTKEILQVIVDDGWFHNFRGKKLKEIRNWIKQNFNASDSVARKLSRLLN